MGHKVAARGGVRKPSTRSRWAASFAIQLSIAVVLTARVELVCMDSLGSWLHLAFLACDWFFTRLKLFALPARAKRLQSKTALSMISTPHLLTCSKHHWRFYPLCNFSDLGEILSHVWYLRLVPAVFSSLVIPCIYEVCIVIKLYRGCLKKNVGVWFNIM